MPTTDDLESPQQPLSRDDLIALIARVHKDSAYREAAIAGRTLAAQSRLPKLVAENLGAGLGQWDFFPDAAEIVDFALAYIPPATEEEIWTMARAWAADDAAARPSLMALVGREILRHELRRVDVPKLRELIDEARPTRARELRTSLGLAAPPPAPATGKSSKSRPSAANPSAKRVPPAMAPDPSAKGAPAAAGVPAAKREAAAAPGIPAKMPKAAFRPPVKPAPKAAAKRFHHPKFGEGVLEAQDGVGPEAKLTIKFESGSKTLLARYVTESPA